MTAAAPAAVSRGRRIRLIGTTQGVGLRPHIHRLATSLDLAGRAINTPSGVEIEAFGSEAALDALVEGLGSPLPGAGRIEALICAPLEGIAPEGFCLGSRSPGSALDGTDSLAATGRPIALAPDLALCDACRAELDDVRDRRHRHPFIGCTDCGPRVGIATALPWDRAHTTMATLSLCARCRDEFDDPKDRRHHAETIACPDCGPRLSLESSAAGDATAIGGLGEGDGALAGAIEMLRRGAILAVRGIGGYHLACRADAADAVARLRKSKRRPRKPFAVMVADVDDAARIARLDQTSRTALTDRAAPIVLLERLPTARVAPNVAPDLPWIGVMLAYTPLHWLLVDSVGAPLVMTSGNARGEPIVTAPAEARERLAGFADAFLHHDREIVAPCDDSVVQASAGRLTLLRRSRGCFPGSLPLPFPAPASILAVGAQMANTVCIAQGRLAHPSAHIGDLDSPESADAHEAAIRRLEDWLGTTCEIVAHDLHPGYTSTRLARRREAAHRVPVQHHHAHVASAFVELQTEGPVVGVAFDGTGAGTDGTAWGGEILLVRPGRFERLATLRPIPLVGGEVAIREVWRLALALLDDAYGTDAPLEAIGLFRELDPERVEAVRALLHSDVPCVPAHGVGRYFDAFGSLFLDRASATHQGDVAMHWNAVADRSEDRAYPFALAEARGRRPTAGHAPRFEIDLRECVRAAVADRFAGRPAAAISGRFHATLARATAAVLARCGREVAGRPVVLTGGCFQNALLVERVQRALSDRFAVHVHGAVPPGDGGISIGQAVVAAAVARAGGGDAHLRDGGT